MKWFQVFFAALLSTVIVPFQIVWAQLDSSDVTPKHGRATNAPPGATSGPWYERIVLATSPEGLDWTHTFKIISDQAAVPDMIVDPQGRTRIYYVDWGNGNILVCAINTHDSTWIYRRVHIAGLPTAKPDPVDPDIQLLPDGQYRFYFTRSEGGQRPATYSALSSDGINFSLEPGVRFAVSGKDVLDPSTIRVGDSTHYFAGGLLGNYHAVSVDGLTFVRRPDVIVAGRDIKFANGIAVFGGYRFYGFDNRPPKNILSMFSTDGYQWTLEPGIRLDVDASTRIESEYAIDAAVAQLPDGSYSMAFVTLIPVTPTGAIDWKTFFTLKPDEGISFSLDTTAVIPNAGVPGPNIANDGRVILGYAGEPGGRGQAVSNDNGRTFTPLSGYAAPQAGDGAFIYLPDGRTRFIAEEPLPTSTPQRHKGRLVSWISFDGINWSREAGVRYQPGAEDDSIASVPAALQVADSLWRMYYVGDWYRSNGTRTAISTDWGWSWKAESRQNILRNHDVDPHPVYLTDGRVRIYHRHMRAPGGIAFTEGDGLAFDTTKTQLLLPDGVGFPGSLFDPAVVKFPNGDVACYIGAVPFRGQPGAPKIIAAWALKSTGVVSTDGAVLPDRFQLYQNYPNPFNPATTIRFSFPKPEHVTLRIFDSSGREVKTLVAGKLPAGEHSIVFDAAGLPSGVYFYQIKTSSFSQTRKAVLLQ